MSFFDFINAKTSSSTEAATFGGEEENCFYRGVAKW